MLRPITQRVDNVKVNHFISEVTMRSSRLVRYSIYALTAYPIVDFGLRHSIPFIGVIWDKVIFLVLLSFTVLRYWNGCRLRRPTWQRFAIYFFLWGLALIFADMAHPMVAISGYSIDVYYVLFGFFVPYAIDPKDVVKFLYAGSAVAILIAIHGVYQYLTKAPIPISWIDVNEHVRTRVYSVFLSPNELGSYMALMIPVIGGLAMSETDTWRKWAYRLGLIPCVLTLLFTFTRAAWFSLGISIILMAIIFERRLLLFLVFFLALALFIPAIHHRISDLFSPAYWITSAKAGRLARWAEAFNTLSTNPLFGVGLGHYGGTIASQHHYSMFSDNYYAKTLGETGLVGLTLFMAFHVALMRDLFVKVKNAIGRKKFALIGGMTGLIAVLIHNTMENVFEYAPMTLSYFLYVSLFLVWRFPQNSAKLVVKHHTTKKHSPNVEATGEFADA